MQGAWNAVLGWIEGGINGAIDLINGMIAGVNTIGAVVGIELAEIPTVSLPRLALGATVLPRRGGTAAILAEAGKPETVVDTGLLNQALRDGLTGTSGKGTSFTQNNYIAHMPPEEAVDMTGQRMSSLARQVRA